ncbi:MAG TPA: sugar phosphate isomerase/epimerase [Mycobacteriales bacterium]
MCTPHDATASHEEVARLLSRRGFLRTAAVGAAVVGASGALATPAVAAVGSGGGDTHSVPRSKISIQLYSLRDQLAIDLQGTLNALAAIGYQKVEHAGFVGRTVAQFKAALDAANLRSSSGHTLIPQPFDAAAWQASLQDALTLGSSYIVHPFFGINFGTGAIVRDGATWAAFAHDLNRAGQMAKAVGLRLGYHNHNWEFFRLADDPTKTAYDVLIEETDPRYVHFEMDLFWVTRGARDPVDLLRRLNGRVLQYHVKDMNQAGSFEDPGQGLIDFPRIFRSQQVDEYIVERDDAGSPPRTPAQALDTARVGYQYLSTVRF